MSKFAKLFETKEYGQILVLLQSGDTCDVEVRVFAQPPNLGVSSFAFQFEKEDEDEAWDLAQEAFNEIDEAKAKDLVKTFFKHTEELF